MKFKLEEIFLSRGGNINVEEDDECNCGERCNKKSDYIFIQESKGLF